MLLEEFWEMLSKTTTEIWQKAYSLGILVHFLGFFFVCFIFIDTYWPRCLFKTLLCVYHGYVFQHQDRLNPKVPLTYVAGGVSCTWDASFAPQS